MVRSYDAEGTQTIWSEAKKYKEIVMQVLRINGLGGGQRQVERGSWSDRTMLAALKPFGKRPPCIYTHLQVQT